MSGSSVNKGTRFELPSLGTSGPPRDPLPLTLGKLSEQELFASVPDEILPALISTAEFTVSRRMCLYSMDTSTEIAEECGMLAKHLSMVFSCKIS